MSAPKRRAVSKTVPDEVILVHAGECAAAFDGAGERGLGRDAAEERIRFARTMAHDLRASLQMVSAFFDLLAKDYGERLDERGLKYLTYSVEAVTRMSGLLDDVVEFEQIGGPPDHGSWFDADDVLGRALEALADRLCESGAAIAHEPLPRLFGDPIRFQRLLRSLIGNAVKYVEPGQRPQVRIQAVGEGEFWRFSVMDKGIGVDPRHAERIFEPFKRLHPQSCYPGAGLGLAMCAKIVEGFGGRIWVSPAEGGGSNFSFTVKRPDVESGHG